MKDRWPVYVTEFPPEKVKAVRQLAKSKRMSAGAYIGMLLDRELRNAGIEETGHGYQDIDNA